MENEFHESNDINSVDLEHSQFINPEDGTAMLPSLINPEDEEKFQIKRNFYVHGYPTLIGSVQHIRQYELSDQYNNVFDQLDMQDQYWLKFIGMFKSVQKLQLKREARMYPQLVSENNLDHSLKILFRNGLIMKWDYKHPIDDQVIKVYTLTGNGYRFLVNFYNENYFHPQDFFNLNPRYHLRFWETLDVYQLLVSLPAYRASSTLFRGNDRKRRLLPSPLQISLEMKQGDIKNLVFYPCLYNDNPAYYKDATLKWNRFTKDGANLNEKIGDLPEGQNVLTFYTPTIERAAFLNKYLNLSGLSFPSLFMVGLDVTNYGLPKAFYEPNRKTGGLKQLNFQNLLRTDKNEVD